jgi:hypothetical protein
LLNVHVPGVGLGDGVGVALGDGDGDGDGDGEGVGDGDGTPVSVVRPSWNKEIVPVSSAALSLTFSIHVPFAASADIPLNTSRVSAAASSAGPGLTGPANVGSRSTISPAVVAHRVAW